MAASDHPASHGGGHRVDLLPDPRVLMTVARGYASRMVRRGEIPPRELEDVAGELVVAVLANWRRYDQARSQPLTFAAVAMRSRAVTVLRARRAAKRRSERLFCELAQHALREPIAQTGESQWSLSRDVMQVISALPADLKNVACLLQKESSTAAARLLRISRYQIQLSIKLIAEQFRKSGLEC